MPLRTAPLPFEIPAMRVMAQIHSARCLGPGSSLAACTEVHAAADNIFDAEIGCRANRIRAIRHRLSARVCRYLSR